ncbi:MAG: arsenate reductase ArsC [bacterium]
MNKIKVLFLCSGNTARSQMAEAFLRKEAGDRFEVYSAGLEPGEIHPYVIQVMKEIGVDISGQYSKSFEEYLGKFHFDYIITVCDRVKKACPTVLHDAGQILHWSFEDPVSFEGPEEERLNKFREIRDRIHERIELWLNNRE